MKNTYEQIKFAIENKKQISCTYQEKYRECCPHALGLKNGKYNCMMYQFGGFSSKGEIILGVNDDWRCMELEDIKDFKILDGSEWHTKNNHSHSNYCIDNVEVEITY